MSDHEAVTFTLYTTCDAPNNNPHRTYLFHKANTESMLEDVRAFKDLFFQSDPYKRPVENNWNNFKDMIFEMTNRHVPSRMVKNRKEAPWLNREIKRKISKRRRLYNKAKATQNENDWKAYRKLRNEVNSLVDKAHNNYCKYLFDDSHCNNRKRFWSLIKNLKKDHPNVTTLESNDSLLTSSVDIANAFNDQFYTFFTDEDNETPNLDIPTYPICDHIIFSTEGIENLLQQLDTSKAPGPDGIPTQILKLCRAEIAPILQVIFTQSFTTNNLPTDWLTANVVPVHKKGNRNSANNYRPISLTSTCCKVMEHIVFHSIMNHVDQNNILNNCQHGFRPKYSCQSQLVMLTEEILKVMDQQKQIDLILLDFSKAFDSVPHKRLLQKLSHYGIQGDLHQWIKAWLTQRKQRVVLNNVTSRFVPVKSGVPQGTVLGPLMFLLYINDISTNINSSIRLFADDCIIYRIIDSEEDNSILQQDLNKVFHWAKTWQMKLNVEKCVFLRCSRSKTPMLTTYSIDNKALELKSQHPYLGVIFHQSMSWSHHIDHLCGKATKSLNFLKRNISKCSKEVKITAYLTSIRPLLEYASCVWDPHQLYLINTLEKVQRRAARWVASDYNPMSSVTYLLDQLHWKSLQSRRCIDRLNLLYRVLHHALPSIQLPEYFKPTSYPTRLHHQYRYIIPPTRTLAYQQSYFPGTIKQWNNLPNHIIDTESLEQFNNCIFGLDLL